MLFVFGTIHYNQIIGKVDSWKKMKQISLSVVVRGGGLQGF